MTENATSWRDRTSNWGLLRSVRRRNELPLLSRYFRKLERHTRRRQQLLHLKRCAFLLKHYGIRRIVTQCFTRWLGATQRETSLRAGRRELTKIVAFPRNQDFIDLGIRWLRRWRLWVRKLRHRKRTNVELLQLKISEGRMHRTLHRWMSLTLEGQKDKLHESVHALDRRNSVLNDHVAHLQAELDQKERDIRELSLRLEDIKERGASQSIETKELRKTLEVSIHSLLHARSSNDSLDIIKAKHIAEEFARRGDEAPLRLLTDCEAAACAVSRLRKLLPDGAVHSAWDFNTIADAVCKHTKELDAHITELHTNVRNGRALAVFLLNFVHDGAERVLHFVNHSGVSDPPSLHSTLNEKSLALPLSDCTSHIEYLLGKSVSYAEAEMVRAHLTSSQALSEKAQPTASVLRSFYDTLLHLRRKLMQADDLYAEQCRAVQLENARRHVLASASADAVQALRHWKTLPDISISTLSRAESGSMDEAEDEDASSVAEEELIAQLWHESRSAAQTLAALREALAGNTFSLLADHSTSHSEVEARKNESVLGADALSLSALPPIVSHNDLPGAVRELRDRLAEIGAAYNELCNGIRQCGTGLLSSSPGFSTAAKAVQGRVSQAERVVQEVRKNISGRISEVKALRRAMRNGIAALGGSGDESESDDNVADAELSTRRSLVIGEKLVTLCSDTGTAIDDTKVALGIHTGTRVPLSEIIPTLKERMHELEIVKTESAALAEDIRCALSAETPQGSDLSLRRCLKPKTKPDTCAAQGTFSSAPAFLERLPRELPTTPSAVSVPADKVIQNLRCEVKERAEETRSLHRACAALLAFLDGSLTVESSDERSQRWWGKSLVPFIHAQAEEIKRAQRFVDEVLPDGPGTSRSVGGRMALLAETVESLRLSVADLRAECDLRARQSVHIMNDFTSECRARTAAGSRRMSRAADALRLCAGRQQAQRCFAEWRAAAQSRRMSAAAALLDAALADLSLGAPAVAPGAAGGTAAAVSARAAAVAEAAEDVVAERALLRRRAAEREAFARELKRVTAELHAAGDAVDARDAKIAQMAREHRDARLAAALCGEVQCAPREGRGAGEAAERALIAEAKRFALEAMDAMASSDVAATVSAVAERTLELYRRTTGTLDEMRSSAGVGEEWLAELQSLSGVRDDIAARLPAILTAPHMAVS